MKVCIAGGGKVGMYLAQSLLTHRHKVTIIEPQEALCRSLADTLDVPVICGDAINFDTLRTADVSSCDAFVAVTSTDEDNLVACQIAKREFGVDRTVARASNPKNRELLHTLGVDTVVCGTDNLSHILEREIETDTIRQLLSLGGGTASLNEILLPENFAYAGKPIKEVPIPGNAILVSITRDTEFIIPHGNTTLLPWDRILCLTQDDTLHLLTEAWGLTDKGPSRNFCAQRSSSRPGHGLCSVSGVQCPGCSALPSSSGRACMPARCSACSGQGWCSCSGRGCAALPPCSPGAVSSSMPGQPSWSPDRCPAGP